VTEAINEDRARGLMLGLLVGDAVGEIQKPKHEWYLYGTALGQLACFTVEGLIRGFVKQQKYEAMEPPFGTVWTALNRWAAIQGYATTPGFGPELAETGWLRQLAPLRAKRGTAPATVKALVAGGGTTESPVGSSAGHHALNRVAPLALASSFAEHHEAGARELAAQTHGHSASWDAAAAGVLLLRGALESGSVSEAIARGTARAVRVDVIKLLEGEDSGAAAGTASYCLVRAMRTAQGGGTLREVVTRASEYGVGCATFAGALHGALHGVAGIEYTDFERLELAWVADTLVKDLLREEREHPGPGWLGTVSAIDPVWITKYPAS